SSKSCGADPKSVQAGTFSRSIALTGKTWLQHGCYCQPVLRRGLLGASAPTVALASSLEPDGVYAVSEIFLSACLHQSIAETLRRDQGHIRSACVATDAACEGPNLRASAPYQRGP